MNRETAYPIETPRLKLVPYRPEFGDALYELKSLKETHRYNYTKPMTRSEARSYAEKKASGDSLRPKDRLELAVLSEDRYIGFAGLKGADLNRDGTGELFYTLHRDYFGRGLGYETAYGLCRFGFEYLKLHRIWAGAAVENAASWRIMEKLGMRRESRWIGDRPAPGVWHGERGFEKTDKWEDGFGYAIIREEWFSGK